jgi:signal transduction histidine kinase
MRSSLIFKLMGAFLLVIAIGAVVISLLTRQATQFAFNLYTTRSGQAWAQSLAPVLADYYAQKNDWQGVDALLQSGLTSGGIGAGHMMGQGRGFGASGAAMGTMMGQRLVLADAQGMVVSDTGGELVGTALAPQDISNGQPVLLGDQQVGTLIVTPNTQLEQGTPASDFLDSVNSSILTAVVIAGIIALILGAGLFIQITAPMRQLQKAASSIAAGDLSQRVTVRSQDEIGRLGQTFNTMAESLARAETQRRHMVADVAHELRTPLAVIQANAEGMLDGVLPFEPEQVNAIYQETLLLNRLVGDLRLLSLAEAGELRLERQPTAPGALVEQVVEHMQPQAAQRGVRLEGKIQAGLPERALDADRITQVLTNLVGNALRYTPPDGTIVVEAGTRQEGRLQITVTDSGPGIQAGDLPYVFDRFYRADKSRARASGGSGLGLAIVKQLVEAHGGQVSVASPADPKNNNGTRFTIIL